MRFEQKSRVAQQTEEVRTLCEHIDIPHDSIILVSGELPGTGSTSVTQLLSEVLETARYTTAAYSIGNIIRELVVSKGFSASEEGMMQAKAAGVIPDDPEQFDQRVYEEALLQNGVVIIEGKAATHTGYHILQRITDRPIYLVDLRLDPVTSAIRVLRREGYDLEHIFRSPELLPQYRNMILDRTNLIKDKLQNSYGEEKYYPNKAKKRLQINTAHMQPLEVVSDLLSSAALTDTFSSWEEESLIQAVDNLYSIYLSLTNTGAVHQLDEEHFLYNVARVKYAIQQAKINTNKEALDKVRERLSQDLISLVYALLMKILPRYFYEIGTEKNIVVDTVSQKWTPEFYKVINGWDSIVSHLKDTTVLDPFAGSGTYLNLLTAKGVVSHAYMSDLSYPGGKALNGYDVTYAPEINMIVFQSIFDELPSWYYPKIDESFSGFITADALHLPFSDNAVDWITGDPPYGKNLQDGSIGLLKTMLPELFRVSRMGLLLMVPIDWVDDLLKLEEYKTTQLTTDLSSGFSHFKICLVKMEQNVEQNSESPIVSESPVDAFILSATAQTIALEV